MVDNQPWFKAKDVATTLGYIDAKRAIQNNVDNDYKHKMEDLMGDSQSPMDYQARTSIYIYINEAGLWSLVLRRGKPEAKQFQKWIVKDLLPTIRRAGSYSRPRYTQQNSPIQ